MCELSFSNNREFCDADCWNFNSVFVLDMILDYVILFLNTLVSDIIGRGRCLCVKMKP